MDFLVNSEIYSKSGTINLLDQQSRYSGMGIAFVKFTPGGRGYRIPALYVPGCSMNILSNIQLHKLGIKVSHDPVDPHLSFPDKSKVPMSQERNISLVRVQRPAPFVGNMLLDVDVPTLWHARTMHASARTLQQMGIIKGQSSYPTCETCLQCKTEKIPLKLDKGLKDVPTKPGELVVFDVMDPAQKEKGAVLLAIDVYSRMTVGECIHDLKAETLKIAFHKLLNRIPGTIKRVVLDRQSGFTTTDFVNSLVKRSILYKYAPPGRHLE